MYLLIGLGPLTALLLGRRAADPGRGGGGFLGLIHLRGAREAGVPWAVSLLYPVIALIFCWIVLRAMVLNLWQGGIAWRGTFYPLSELRRNRV